MVIYVIYVIYVTYVTYVIYIIYVIYVMYEDRGKAAHLPPADAARHDPREPLYGL
jgi:hypothetical protein